MKQYFNIEELTSSQLMEYENITTFSNIIETLEELEPDSLILFDKNLEPIIEGLEESFNFQELQHFNKCLGYARYSHFMDIFYLTDYEMYIVELFVTR